MRKMKRTGSGSIHHRPPVWLVVLLTLGLLVRLNWLSFAQGRLHGSYWSDSLLPLLLSWLSILLTWYVAASLASYAGLSERGTERFTVMSTLLMVAPPLPILAQQLSSWLTSTVSLVLLALLMLQRKQSARHSMAIKHYFILRRLYRLTSLPLLCAACVALLCAGSYLLHEFSHPFLPAIITILFTLGWPYTIGAFFTLPYLVTQYQQERALLDGEQAILSRTSQTIVFHVAMLIIIGIYFIAQLSTYILLIH